ncbi:serine protease 33-like [Labrus mixtus]|uniref:serine protease 33-like n=1 Tax=Labrus mixtus TaxID=508554 RepID=UPI0029C00479|nr:serine protease 33-like [Labrus mixtus]
MALYKLLSGVTVMILLTSNGCHADDPGSHPSCGRELKVQDLDDHLPWQVVIQLPKEQCLGNLISPYFVLTDGNCGYGPERVFLGRKNKTTGSYEDWKDVANITCDVRSKITKEGVCLLQLSHPVNFTDTIYPICIASPYSQFDSTLDSWVSTGYPGHARVQVPFVGNNECDCFLRKRPMDMVCAGYRQEHIKKMDNCLGNLGGALMAKFDGDYWSIIGVVNVDPTCPLTTSLRGYTNVTSHAYWIGQVTGIDQNNFTPFALFGNDTDSEYECPTTPFPTKFPKPHTPDPSLCLNPWADDCREDFESVFGNGVAMQSSPFILLCVLVLSFYSMNW